MAEFRSREILERLKDWFTRLDVSMRANKALKHQDANIQLENFFRDLLNAVYGWNLVNANGLISTDQDSYDLSDDGESLAAQVTVTTGSAKIKKTLKSFVGAHDEDYQRLVFAYPFVELPRSTAQYHKEKKKFDFQPKRDRIGLGTILSKISHLPLADQEQILKLVSDHLKPLGKAIHLGSDDVLDTLIEVIAFMSDNAPEDEVTTSEKDPDYEAKRERLAEYVEYLEQQYSVNAGCHAAIEQAREAIGYDQPRVAKIQAWLKGQSISLLRSCDGNAGEAFDALAQNLLIQAHQTVGNAEMTAVRFLLADEFQRCNVFPNP